VYQALVEQYNGTTWSVVSSPDQTTGTDNELLGVSADSPSDVWAVGYYNSGTQSAPVYQTLVEQYNGTTWSVVSSPDTSSDQANVLEQVAVASGSDLWAVGSDEVSSGSSTVSQTLVEGTPTASTTDLSPSTNPSFAEGQVTFTASVSASASTTFTPTGTVTFTSDGTTLSGCGAVGLSNGEAQCTATFATAGSFSIATLYSGDDNFLPSTTTLTQAVDPLSTYTTLAASPASVLVAQPFTLTATVTPQTPGEGTPTGTVEFEDAGSALEGCAAQELSSGVATCTTSFASPDSYTFSAAYSGDSVFAASTSPAVTFLVGATSTALTSSSDPAVAGNSVTYTAVVTPQVSGGSAPTGIIEFSDSSSVIEGCGEVALNGGEATCSVVYPLNGTHSIAATYLGSSDYLSSISDILTQTVGTGLFGVTTDTTGTNTNPLVANLWTTFLGSGQFVAAVGNLNSIEVSDNRGTETGWSATAQLEGGFFNDDATGSSPDNTIPADFLTWVPNVSAAVAAASLNGVSAGATSTLSDTTAVPLCSAADGSGGSDYDCGASLSLSVPPYLAAGTYVAALDIVVTAN
jgi:hypothetical protein